MPSSTRRRRRAQNAPESPGRIVIVCGSRNWQDEVEIAAQLAKLPKGSIVLEGGAPGADRLAGRVASRMGFHVACMSALWQHYSQLGDAEGNPHLFKAAGPARNRAMLRLGLNPVDSLIAFHENDSPGTADMIALAEEAGLPTTVIGGGS